MEKEPTTMMTPAAHRSPSWGAILVLVGALLLVAILAAAALFTEVERTIVPPTNNGVGKVRAAERSANERSPASPVAGGHEISGVGSSKPG
jgi:hypothetical protein